MPVLREPRYARVLTRYPHWELRSGDAGFPAALLDLRQKGLVLYGVGDASILRQDCISVIGARRSTPYGITCARMAGRVAAECGITVVSGGAVGCDCAAGTAALDAGGKTVVIPGCGADVLYPRSSDELFCRAVEGGGCVLSIEGWGMGPTRYTFVNRNSVIAALSASLVVCEAGKPSGTFGTATVAAELNRRVYAVPGSIFSPTSRGTNWLIETGAAIVSDEQALEGLIALDYGRLRLVGTDRRAGRGKLLDALVASPLLPEEIGQLMGLDMGGVLAMLSEHEALGFVRRLPNGRFCPTERAYLGQNGRGAREPA